jgi:hypothetical protein
MDRLAEVLGEHFLRGRSIAEATQQMAGNTGKENG